MLKSIKHTWQLFSLEDGSPAGAHFTMIVTPLILAFGVALLSLNFVNIIGAVIVAIVVFVLVAYLMGWNNPDENDMIERRLNADTGHIYPLQTPHQYVGPKRWIALGRINPDEFLAYVMERDPILKKVPYTELRSRVEYTYMADTFSMRNSSPAIKYVSESTKGAYPVTHLRAPYDYFVEKSHVQREFSDES